MKIKFVPIPSTLVLRWRYIAAGILLILAAASRLKFNGLVYNFDFGLYFPDGAHYTFRTLNFLGYSQQQAAEMTSNWYSLHGVKQSSIDPNYLIPETNPVWRLVSPRIIYPLLSAPFVYLFGIPGMLVVPVISLAILVFVLLNLAEGQNKGNLGLLLTSLLLSSTTVLRWMISNCTDALLAGLFAISCVVLIKSPKNAKSVTYLLLLVLLTTYTRFCLPIWLGISIYIWIGLKDRILAFITLVASSFASIPLLYLQFTSTPASESSSSLLLLPYGYVKVAVVELGQLLILDRPLALILIFAAFLAVKNYRETSSFIFFAFLFGVWTIGAMNPVAGVNFRYQLPLIIPAIYVLISGLNEISKGPSSVPESRNR